jgi:hypothetical protein
MKENAKNEASTPIISPTLYFPCLLESTIGPILDQTITLRALESIANMPGILEDDEPDNGSKVVGIREPQQAKAEKAISFQEEVWTSTDLLFQSRLTWLLILGPIAVVGQFTGTLGPATCFIFAGMALIPCAER